MKRLISCLLTAVFMLCAFPLGASAGNCVIYRNGKVVADTVFLDGTTYFSVGLDRKDSDFASPTLFYKKVGTTPYGVNSWVEDEKSLLRRWGLVAQQIIIDNDDFEQWRGFGQYFTDVPDSNIAVGCAGSIELAERAIGDASWKMWDKKSSVRPLGADGMKEYMTDSESYSGDQSVMYCYVGSTRNDIDQPVGVLLHNIRN